MSSPSHRSLFAVLLSSIALLAGPSISATAEAQNLILPGERPADARAAGPRLPRLDSEAADTAFLKRTIGLPVSSVIGRWRDPDRPFLSEYGADTSDDNNDLKFLIAPRAYFDALQSNVAEITQHTGGTGCNGYAPPQAVARIKKGDYEAVHWRLPCAATYSGTPKGFYLNVLAATDGERTFAFLVRNWRHAHWWSSMDSALAEPDAQAVWTYLSGLAKQGV